MYTSIPGETYDIVEMVQFGWMIADIIFHDPKGYHRSRKWDSQPKCIQDDAVIKSTYKGWKVSRETFYMQGELRMVQNLFQKYCHSVDRIFSPMTWRLVARNNNYFHGNF